MYNISYYRFTVSSVIPTSQIKIDQPEFPEPENDITFYIDSKNEDIHIIIDFGDGSEKLRTRDKTVVHKYKEHGTYKPKISICLGCEGNNVMHEKILRILSYVEKPAGLNVVTPVSTLFGTSTSISAILKEGSFFNCTWNFGDQSKSVDTIYKDSKNHTIQHEYKAPGVYQGLVSCYNRKATLSRSFKVDIQEDIKNLVINEIAPQSVDKEFKFTWRVSQGFPIDYIVMINNVEQAVTQSEKDGEATILPSVFQGKHGDYEITVSASNNVTTAIIATKTISVYPTIKPVTIVIPKHTVEVNESVPFAIDSTNPHFKKYPKYEWDFGDGNYKSSGSENKTVHQYAVYGTVLAKLTTKNPVSSQVSFVEINILRPVIKLKGLSCKGPPTVSGIEAELACSLDIGSDFTCTVDWDGKGTTHSNFTHLKYYIGQSTSKDSFENLEFKDHFIFEYANEYVVRTTCNNRLYQVSSQTKIIIQDKVKDLSISGDKSQSFGNSFRMSWQARGTNVQYKIFWNGKELKNIELVDGKPSSKINQEIYKITGIHVFAVEAWNHISDTIRKEITIVIEDDVKDIDLSIISENSFLEVHENFTLDFRVRVGSNPHYRISFSDDDKSFVLTTSNKHTHSFKNYGVFTATVTAYNNVSETTVEKQINVLKPVLDLGEIELSIPHENVSESVSIIAILSKGSDFTCHIDFGDDHDHNTTQLHSTYYTTEEERQAERYHNLEIEFSHAYSEIKTFELSMTCTNRKGSVSATSPVSIFKPLVPFKIEVPRTNEQNTPIPIVLSQENDIELTDHEFEVDFGDSSEMLKTKQNNLEHSYTEYGEYIIVVVAKSPVSSITIKQKIVILKPVVVLKDLRLSAVPVNFTEPTPLSIRLGQGSDFKCTIKWNSTYEKVVDKTTDLVYYADSKMEPFQDVFLQAKHIYTTEGHHQVAVTCSNRLGSVTKDITVITQIALKGFFLKPILPQEYGKAFNIFYEIERGSDLEIKCEFNGKAVNVIKKDRRVYITSDLYTTPGVYDVTFTGSNLVSSEITRKGSVIIDKRIQNVTINASKLSLEVNETVTFDFGSLVGSAVVYDVDFDDGVTETKIAKRTQLEHKFSLQGVYTITITAYNSISKEQNSIRVTVLKPVLPLVGLTLEVPQRVNISSSYSMKLLLDQGSDFDCTIDCGNGAIDKISNQKTEYYTTEPYWEIKNFKNIVMIQKKAFPKVGELTIKAICKNRLHEIKAQTTINIYVPVSDFTIVSSKYTIEINETIDMEVKGLDSVTVPTLVINSGKHGKQLTINTFDFKNSFTHHGLFNVAVNVSNPTSNAEKQIEILVLKPVLELSGLSATATPTNLSSEASVVVTMKRGSDYKCTVTWGDSSSSQPESHDFVKKYNFYNDMSLNDKPFTDIKMEFKHKYEEIGEYVIDIKCSNRKNEVNTKSNIVIQTPISSFELIKVEPQRFGSSFQLKWLTEGGSNIEFTIFWEKTTMAYQKSVSENRENFVTITPKDYTTATIHKYTICAKNKVSDAGNLTSHVIIEDELEGLVVELSKYQEVEVNETIQVSTKLDSGNNPHFKYHSGVHGVTSEELLRTQYPFSYTKQGNYKIKVQAWNNVSRVEAEASVTVIKPVLPVTKVHVKTAIAYDTNKTTKIDVIISRGSDFKCLIVFGDGTEEMTATMNSDYYGNGRKENLKKYENTKHTFYHNYTVGDVYNVQVTCSNRISSQSASGMVFVQAKIDGLYIKPLTPKKVGEQFQLKYQATQGTNLTYFVHFQNKVYYQHSDRVELISKLLSSDRPGVFNILINATNHITGIIVKKTVVIIEDPILDLQIHSPLSNTNFEVGEEFQFCYSIKQGSNPHFTPEFDQNVLALKPEDTKGKLIEGGFQLCFKHSFDLHANFTKGDAQLNMNLTLTAKNNVSESVKEVNVVLLKPVNDIKMHSFTCAPTTTDTESRLVMSVSGSDLICTWKIEDKDTVLVPLSNILHKDGISENSKFENLEKTQVAEYNTPGAYNAFVECTNRKNTQALSTVCLVQDEIVGVKVEEFGSKEFGKLHNIVWSEEKGTNITYLVKINGISFSNISQNVDGKHYITLPDDIASTPGDYHGEIIASNLVTKNLVTKFTIRLERKLQIEDVQVTYGNRKTGQGDGTYYPVRKDITFFIQTNALVFDVQWTILLSPDNTTELSETHKSFVNRFEEHGVRTIKYHVSNNISSAEGVMVLNIIEAAGFIVLSSNTPQWIGHGMNFTVLMPEKGQETCFRFDAGDGHVYYYTTEKGDCREFYPELTLKNITGIFPKHQDSLLITHNYTTWNFYTAQVTAVNHLSKQNASTRVLASQVICNFPTTNITNLGISPFYPTRLAKSEKMTVYLDAEFNCEYISKAKYEWAIYKYNQINGKLTPVLLDNRTYTFDPYTQKDLVIKKKSLSYGIYLIKSTVTMNDPKASVFRTSARGYLQVYPSTLVAAVEGGALIRRGFGKPIPFSGGASCDPDINKNNYTGKNLITIIRPIFHINAIWWKIYFH